MGPRHLHLENSVPLNLVLHVSSLALKSLKFTVIKPAETLTDSTVWKPFVDTASAMLSTFAGLGISVCPDNVHETYLKICQLEIVIAEL